MNDPIADVVTSYILDEFLPGTSRSELTADTPLITDAILDSLATIKLVSFLEERYDIQIHPHEAMADHLDTVTAITALVRSKVGDREPA